MQGRYPLKELFVEVTNSCLLYCRHCSSEASAANKEYIPARQLYRLIDEGIHLGLEKLTISGGEPVQYHELFQVLEYAAAKGIELAVYSCGVVEDDDGNLAPLSEQLVKHLIAAGTAKVIFSIHGGSAGTHDYITRVAGSFALTLESIKRVLSAGLPVELHFVPMNVNVNEIPEVMALASSLGIGQVSLLRLVQQGRCRENAEDLMLSGKKAVVVVKQVKQLKNWYRDINIRLGAPFNCVKDGDITPCSASQNKLLISATGEVFPCEAFKFLKGKRNKIYDWPLEELWFNDDLLNKLRSLHLQDIVMCSECAEIEKCRGGCPGERMLFNRDVSTGPEPWCRLKI
ncbi:MAG: radical SAM protein [Desulfotomaculaceae bacterium]|nr:radical SAM protein [Desulfotomaculaceae bacterium]